MPLFAHYKGFDIQEERKKGEKQGEKRGEKTGERKLFIKLVCNKLSDGMSSSTIAKEIYKSVSFVNRIKKVAVKYAPDYDVQKIFDELYPSKKQLTK